MSLSRRHAFRVQRGQQERGSRACTVSSFLVTVVLLVGAGLCLVPALFYLKLEIRKYEMVSEIRWRPAVMHASRARWLWIDQSPIEYRHLVVTSRWRREQHLPPCWRAKRGAYDQDAFFSSRSDEALGFAVPEYHEDAVNDMRCFRSVQLQRQPGYFRPFLLVWLTASINAVLSFLLFALVIRSWQLQWRYRRWRQTSLLTGVAALAAAILCTVPKLRLVLYACWCSAPGTDYLDQARWNPLYTSLMWLLQASHVPPFSLLLLIASMTVLLIMACCLHIIGRREPGVLEWRNRFGRTTLYLLPISVGLWFLMSILIDAPVTLGIFNDSYKWLFGQWWHGPVFS